MEVEQNTKCLFSRTDQSENVRRAWYFYFLAGLPFIVFRCTRIAELLNFSVKRFCSPKYMRVFAPTGEAVSLPVTRVDEMVYVGLREMRWNGMVLWEVGPDFGRNGTHQNKVVWEKFVCCTYRAIGWDMRTEWDGMGLSSSRLLVPFRSVPFHSPSRTISRGIK